MAPKLYKAPEVCDLAQLQPFVLRSWEKEFPGIGVQKSSESPRMYRQADLDQLLRIKQLVFVQGLTLAGARRKLEEESPTPVPSAQEVEEVIEVLGADVHNRIAHVRNGLRSILHLLDGRERAYELTSPPIGPRSKLHPVPARPPSARALAARPMSARPGAARKPDAARTKSAARKPMPPPRAKSSAKRASR